MFSGNVSNDFPPKDIKWDPIDQPIPVEVNYLGEYASNGQRDIHILKFDSVEEARKITLASSYGNLNALIIKATPAEGIPYDYEANVPADLLDNSDQLVSFGEFSRAQ